VGAVVIEAAINLMILETKMKKYLRTLIAVLLMALVAGVTAVALPAEPVSAQENSSTAGTIVFQTSSGGAIYAINADGSNLRYLTNGMDPALSPDGQWVAFTRWDDVQNGAFGSVWVINIDGSGERAVVGEIRQPKSPTWSPDGTQLIVAMQDGGRLEPYRYCGHRRPPRNAYDIWMGFDENGERLICYTLPTDTHWGLRQIDVATGAFEDLPRDQYSYSPTWSPANDWQVIFDGESGLVSLDLNLGTTWTVGNNVADHSPVISPDGTRITLAEKQDTYWDIHVMNIDGSGRARLTETPYSAIVQQIITGQTVTRWNNVAPTWSPDGSQIAFLTDRTGRWEIWVMNADGSNQHPLFDDAVNDQLVISYEFVDERVISWQ